MRRWGSRRASFCWIAAALLCDSSDATVFPVFRIRWPVLVWVLARSFWNRVTQGWRQPAAAG